MTKRWRLVETKRAASKRRSSGVLGDDFQFVATIPEGTQLWQFGEPSVFVMIGGQVLSNPPYVGKDRA